MERIFIKKLQAFFQNNGEVNTALIFGSHAKNRIHPHSDIDIAILLKHYRPVKWGKKSKLAAQLDNICHHEVDLLILNQASPHIAYRVIKEGKVIFQKNQSLWNEFTVKTCSMNEDLKILYKKVGRG